MCYVNCSFCTVRPVLIIFLILQDLGPVAPTAVNASRPLSVNKHRPSLGLQLACVGGASVGQR